MRPSLLKRAQSHTNRQTISNLLHSRNSSPHTAADTISGHKHIEEETLPKYNADHFYPVRIGDLLNDRYKVLAKLGYGMTATVWLAKDSSMYVSRLTLAVILSAHSPLHRPEDAGNHKFVTIKINVNILTEDYLKGRKAIAEKLFTANPAHPGYGHIRFMLDTFKLKSKHGEHLCIVYDVLREPIDVCMEKFPNRRFSCEKIRILLPALLQGLDYLHADCQVVHTDLKADNVMMGLGDPTILDRFVQHQLEHPSPRKAPDHHGRIIYQSCTDFGEAPTQSVIASAKITDIGLAQWGYEDNYKPIQSNAFMAPEVILNCGWSYPADIWNLGVMLWDLFETFGLFDAIDTRPNYYRPEKHLGLMIGLLGPPPKELIQRGKKSFLFFDADGKFKYPDYVLQDFTWESSISRLRGEERELFIDFACKMICWLPEDRWTAKQLLEHDFLTKERDPNYLSPTPTLSRASTTSISSIMPSRAPTPGPGPTSYPAHLPFPRTSPQTQESKEDKSPDPSRPPSRASTHGPSSTVLTSRPKPLERAQSEAPPTSINANNQCSQDLIDSILKKGKRQSTGDKLNGSIHHQTITEEQS